MNLNKASLRAYTTASEHGFWDWKCYDLREQKLLLSRKLALIVSEVTEALSVLREPGAPDFDKFEDELADIVIRTLDVAGYCTVDFETAIRKKMEKNESRPEKHGKDF